MIDTRVAWRWRRRAGWPLLVCWALLGAGCAGYQVGSPQLYRQDIRTVHVPMFQSDSLRRNLGERLTEAVVKEIELHTPYKVVHSPAADSVLVGRIVGEQKKVVAEDRNDNARDLEINLGVQVSWYDRRGQYVFQDVQVPFTGVVGPVAFDVSQRIEFIPEAGQSLATAQQEAIQRMARQIVWQMESHW